MVQKGSLKGNEKKKKRHQTKQKQVNTENRVIVTRWKGIGVP